MFLPLKTLAIGTVNTVKARQNFFFNKLIPCISFLGVPIYDDCVAYEEKHCS